MASLALKEEGNVHYRAERYKQAEDCYTRALAEPDAPLEVLYLNRSAARLGLCNWVGAEKDADESVKLAEQAGTPHSWKAFLRRGVGHRQQMMCAQKDLLRALELAPAAEKRRVAAELSLNYSMKRMGGQMILSEYGRPNGTVQHHGHPDYCDNPMAGMGFAFGPPATLLRVKMRDHNLAGRNMDAILGPSANPDPSFWIGKSKGRSG